MRYSEDSNRKKDPASRNVSKGFLASIQIKSRIINPKSNAFSENREKRGKGALCRRKGPYPSSHVQGSDVSLID